MVSPPGSIQTDTVSDTETTNPPLLSPTTSTQTSTTLSFNSPRKRKYRDHIKNLTKENKSLRAKCQKLQDDLQTYQSSITLEQYKALTFKFCESKDTAEFINTQVSQNTKKTRGRRYSKQMKAECLKIFFASPKVYRSYLRKTFCLPGPQTLLNEIRSIQINPGLCNPQFFEMMKAKIDCFEEKDKCCFLCIDEMSLKGNLFYNRASDNVVGLAQNTKGEQFFKPALTACVVMVRGICYKWKQPLAYYFSHTTCSAPSLVEILTETVEKLKAIKLKVCGITTDMGSNNIQLANILDVTVDEPSFHIENSKLFYIFDIPHIIKAIRNMLIKYDFYYEGNRISWQYIKMFYDHDKKYPIRAAPKLTDSHVSPSPFEKMKVKYATQIFSASVSASMNLYIRFGYLPSEAVFTASFVERMDKLFDILNSSKTASEKKYNRAYKGLDYQVDFLLDCLDFFNKLEIRDQLNRNIVKNIKSVKCIKISINSLLGLWDELKNMHNFDYLLTRRLNQDGLENHFGTIRRQNGNCINPTPIQFKRSFRKLQCLTLFHSGTENCEADADQMLVKLNDIPVCENPLPRVFTKNPVQEIKDYQRLDSLEKNFVRYVCGYLLKKGLNLHSCEKCEQYSNAHQELDNTSLFCFFKAYENAERDTFGNLKNPHDDFVNYITSIEYIFQSNFETAILKPNVCGSLLELSAYVPFTRPCENFPKNFILNLYLRLRIYYSLKNINRNFKHTNKNKLIIWRNH